MPDSRRSLSQLRAGELGNKIKVSLYDLFKARDQSLGFTEIVDIRFAYRLCPHSRMRFSSPFEPFHPTEFGPIRHATPKPAIQP
jgi:hypothetical protein